MQKNWNFKNKHIIKIILLMCLFLSMFNYTANAVSNNIENKKVIVLVLDEVDLEELISSNTPNIDYLLENGGIGLMNTRAKSSNSNKGSRYLSMGMGVRTLASTQGGLAFGKDELNPILDHELDSKDTNAKKIYELYIGKDAPTGEILNLGIGDIKRTAEDITPNNEVGLFGRVARENGISIGVIGNSDLDKSSREIVMLAMDERGAVPYGSVGAELLMSDNNILGGIRLDEKKLKSEVERILPKTNILFIEHGDASRTQKTDRLATEEVREEQKNKAIERADSFLGEVMNMVDIDETMFMVLTPNPSRKAFSQGNFGLTPVIISSSEMDQGLLASRTTRREGLVTNFDFGPTVLNYLSEENIGSEFIGESIESVYNESPLDKLMKDQDQFLYLRKYRNVFHKGYIALVAIVMLGHFLPLFLKKKMLFPEVLKYLGLTVMAVPITMMTVSLFGYKYIIVDLLYVFVGAFIIGYLLNKVFKSSLKTMGALGLITSMLLLIDVFIIKNLMIISPLGSDAIAGGRFYGLGNDYMGILLGSAILGLFALYQNKLSNKKFMSIITTIYLSIIIIALSPFFGANMGGTLSAILITFISILTILDIDISWKKLILIGTFVIGAILFIAALDIWFNPNPTHAGKALSSLMTGGLSSFIEIISSKLRQVFWNIAHASWNIILFLGIILMGLFFKFKKDEIENITQKNPILLKGLYLILISGVIIFLFNDTGTIAAALIYMYLWTPLGILINELD